MSSQWNWIASRCNFIKFMNIATNSMPLTGSSWLNWIETFRKVQPTFLHSIITFSKISILPHILSVYPWLYLYYRWWCVCITCKLEQYVIQFVVLIDSKIITESFLWAGYNWLRTNQCRLRKQSILWKICRLIMKTEFEKNFLNPTQHISFLFK